jgi:hypothetical protein
MCSIIYLVGFLIYSLFSTTDLQPWAHGSNMDVENESEDSPKKNSSCFENLEFEKIE